jgi:S-adenosylmethionine synthetase
MSQSSKSRHLFTSESVTEGHPDKVADQVSDAVLDAILAMDPKGRVACETLLTTGLCIVAGEITTRGYVDLQKLARRTIESIGYTDAAYGLDAASCSVLSAIDEQSGDIAMGVDTGGAGDQGMMFGYACRETDELMPMPIMLAHGLTRKLATCRKDRSVPYFRPDGKSQVTVEYIDGKPARVDAIVVSTQHAPEATNAQLEAAVRDAVIKTTIPGSPAGRQDRRSGSIRRDASSPGGPQGDTGLTGRKIIVDTYGGMGHPRRRRVLRARIRRRSTAPRATWRGTSRRTLVAGEAGRSRGGAARLRDRGRGPRLRPRQHVRRRRASRRAARRSRRGDFPAHSGRDHRLSRPPAPDLPRTAAYGTSAGSEPGFTWENTAKAEFSARRRALARESDDGKSRGGSTPADRVGRAQHAGPPHRARALHASAPWKASASRPASTSRPKPPTSSLDAPGRGSRGRLCASNPLRRKTTSPRPCRRISDPTYARAGRETGRAARPSSIASARRADDDLDDGADLVTILHERQDLLPASSAAPRERRPGVIRCGRSRRAAAPLPIVAVNDAVTKQLFDSRHGTGQSTMDGIVRATNVLLAGMRSSSPATGGSARASRCARGLGRAVTVCEVEPVAALEACMDGFRVLRVCSRPPAKVRCSSRRRGARASSAEEHFAVMPDDVLVANAGHYDVEIDVAALSRMASTRRLVRDMVEEFEAARRTEDPRARGGGARQPRAGEGPSRDDHGHELGEPIAVDRVPGGERAARSTRVLPVPKDIDQHVAALKLTSLGVSIDELTVEQRRFLASWSDGA